MDALCRKSEANMLGFAVEWSQHPRRKHRGQWRREASLQGVHRVGREIRARAQATGCSPHTETTFLGVGGVHLVLKVQTGNVASSDFHWVNKLLFLSFWNLRKMVSDTKALLRTLNLTNTRPDLISQRGSILTSCLRFYWKFHDVQKLAWKDSQTHNVPPELIFTTLKIVLKLNNILVATVLHIKKNILFYFNNILTFW